MFLSHNIQPPGHDLVLHAQSGFSLQILGTDLPDRICFMKTDRSHFNVPTIELGNALQPSVLESRVQRRCALKCERLTACQGEPAFAGVAGTPGTGKHAQRPRLSQTAPTCATLTQAGPAAGWRGDAESGVRPLNGVPRTVVVCSRTVRRGQRALPPPCPGVP